MNLQFSNKRITGILTILPSKEIKFDDEMDNYNFSKEQSIKLKKIMGYGSHRIVDTEVCCSDLAIKGLSYLFDSNLLIKDEIDAIIFVSQTPDYLMPATSFIVHGALGLKKNTYCIDINQGCSGYLVGLHQAFMLLDQDEIKKVILINADTLSKKTNKRDRNSYPLIGDAASISIVEKDAKQSNIFSNMYVDGTNNNVIMIPAGGLRLPSSVETSTNVEDEKGNFRSKDNLVMKGDLVYNFVQVEVPIMINNLIAQASINMDDVHYFLFHQPNKFMLQKLADKMKVSYERMPNNVVENFGNSSGASIPTVITHNFSNEFCNNEYLCCLAGFGVGLTWSSMLLKLGNLEFCKTIYY